MDKPHVIAVRMPEWMYEKVKERARVEHRNFSQQVRMYVEQQIEARDREVVH